MRVEHLYQIGVTGLRNYRFYRTTTLTVVLCGAALLQMMWASGGSLESLQPAARLGRLASAKTLHFVSTTGYDGHKLRLARGRFDLTQFGCMGSSAPIRGTVSGAGGTIVLHAADGRRLRLNVSGGIWNDFVLTWAEMPAREPFRPYTPVSFRRVRSQ